MLFFNIKIKEIVNIYINNYVCKMCKWTKSCTSLQNTSWNSAYIYLIKLKCNISFKTRIYTIEFSFILIICSIQLKYTTCVLWTTFKVLHIQAYLRQKKKRFKWFNGVNDLKINKPLNINTKKVHRFISPAKLNIKQSKRTADLHHIAAK